MTPTFRRLDETTAEQWKEIAAEAALKQHRVADNVLQAACVLGTEIKDWRKLDFANLKGRSLLDGKELAAGLGSAVMGGMPISLAWLANKLNEHGKLLKAGDLVLTGSVHPPAFLPGTGVARTEFEGLGATEITIK